VSASEALSVVDPDLVRSLTRAEYHQMIALGLFEDERVELIRGVLVKMSPQLAPHAWTVQRLTELLVPLMQGRYTVRFQAPLALSDDTEPEPDAAVVPFGKYSAEHPRTAVLVIEVSDTSLRKDRRKAAMYASPGIPEYWIVNLDARTVELYTSPEGDRYGESRTLHAGGVLRPMALGDVAIEVADILS
jgi:Uma2 family endonuclease